MSTQLTHPIDRCKTDIGMAGINRIMDRRRHTIQRAVWVLIVSCSFAFVIGQIRERIQFFIDDPILVDIEIIDVYQNDFPAVTICVSYEKNRHPHRSNTSDAYILSDLEQQIFASLLSIRGSFSGKPVRMNYTREELAEVNWDRFLKNMWPPFEAKSAVFVPSLTFAKDNQKRYKSNSFVYTENSDVFMSGMRMPCYTIYDASWQMYGTDGFIYFELFQQLAGHKIIYFISVHQGIESPKIFENSVKVYSSSNESLKYVISVERTDMKMVDHRCVTNDTKLDYFKHYSFQRCWTECYIKYTINEGECKCYTPVGVPYYDPEKMCLPQQWDKCSSTSMGVYKMEKLFDKCNCKPLCKQELYDLTSEKTQVRSSSTSSPVIKVFVKYKTTKVQKIYQKSIATVSKLLAEVGGVFSLLLGMRLLTFVEMLDVVIVTCIERLLKRSVVKLPTQPTAPPTQLAHESDEGPHVCVCQLNNSAPALTLSPTIERRKLLQESVLTPRYRNMEPTQRNGSLVVDTQCGSRV